MSLIENYPVIGPEIADKMAVFIQNDICSPIPGIDLSKRPADFNAICLYPDILKRYKSLKKQLSESLEGPGVRFSNTTMEHEELLEAGLWNVSPWFTLEDHLEFSGPLMVEYLLTRRALATLLKGPIQERFKKMFKVKTQEIHVIHLSILSSYFSSSFHLTQISQYILETSCPQYRIKCEAERKTLLSLLDPDFREASALNRQLNETLQYVSKADPFDFQSRVILRHLFFKSAYDSVDAGNTSEFIEDIKNNSKVFGQNLMPMRHRFQTPFGMLDFETMVLIESAIELDKFDDLAKDREGRLLSGIERKAIEAEIDAAHNPQLIEIRNLIGKNIALMRKVIQNYQHTGPQEQL